MTMDNQQARVWFLPALADPSAPTPDELADGIDLTEYVQGVNVAMLIGDGELVVDLDGHPVRYPITVGDPPRLWRRLRWWERLLVRLGRPDPRGHRFTVTLALDTDDDEDGGGA